MAAPAVPWITTGENVVAYGHPTLPDVANRVLRFIFDKCGIDVTTLGFIGFEPISNVKAYGAVGGGAVDDSGAFLAALNHLLTVSAKGGTILVPNDRYKIGANLVIPTDATPFNGSKIRLKLSPGARLEPTAAVTELISFSNPVAEECDAILEGGILDGTNSSAGCIGVAIHTQNVRVLGTTIKYFKGRGIKYFFNLAAPPICSELARVNMIYNKVGIEASVAAAGLWMHGCRVEGSDEEGVILDNSGHVTLTGNVIETNGIVTTSKCNLRVSNSVDGSIDGNYFESNAYQDHTCVAIEGLTSAPSGLTFSGNRVVGYYETSSGSGVPNSSVGLYIGRGAGAVHGVVAFGNMYVGQHIGCRLGVNASGCRVFGDYFSDSFNDGTLWNSTTAFVAGNVANLGTPGTNYVCVLGNTNQTPPNATYWIKLGTIRYQDDSSALSGCSVDDMNRQATSRTWGGREKKKTLVVAYSASITLDAGQGNWFLIIPSNGTAFTINAPVRPPTSQEEQEIEITIKNITAGALGTITWDAAFRMTAWTSPANGFNRTIRFRWTSSSWYEMSRTPSDIPN